MHLLRFLGAITLAAGPLAACASSTGGSSTGDQASVCDADPRAETYAVGLSATATDGTKVSFVDAMPTPPTKGMNTWTIQLDDGKGQPMNGAAITVYPFMPDHGHGSSITPQVTAMPTAGTYQVSLLDLFMPGIWDVTFTITPTGGTPQTLKFTFCVDG